MITINNLEILNNGRQLAIDVETMLGYNITSILVWSMNDFKDYNLAKDFTHKLEKINNREVMIIEASELNVNSIQGLIFAEIESDYVDESENHCDNSDKPVLGIAYNLSKYYKCLMSYLLEMNKSNCATCKDNVNKDIVITINMMIDSIQKTIEAGYYMQAIEVINNLNDLCSLKDCKNCEEIICKSCNSFKQH